MLVPIATLLEATRAKAAGNSGQMIDRESWRRILGDRIAQHSMPHTYRGRVLTVVVASSVWAQELSLLMPDIIRRLQAAGYGVSELRWQVQPLKQPLPAKAKRIRVTPLSRLPDELELVIGRVADDELRSAIKQAAAHVMGRQSGRASAALRGVRALQSVEPRTSPQDPAGAELRAGSPRTRAKPPS
jgi:hypothetical protein